MSTLLARTSLPALAMVLVVLLLPETADAALVQCTGLDCNYCTFIATLLNVLNWLKVIAAFIAAIVIMWGGFKMLTSAGNQSGYQDGKKFVTNAILGLIVLMAAVTLVDVLIQALVREGGDRDEIRLRLWHPAGDCGGLTSQRTDDPDPINADDDPELPPAGGGVTVIDGNGQVVNQPAPITPAQCISPRQYIPPSNGSANGTCVLPSITSCAAMGMACRNCESAFPSCQLIGPPTPPPAGDQVTLSCSSGSCDSARTQCEDAWGGTVVSSNGTTLVCDRSGGATDPTGNGEGTTPPQPGSGENNSNDPPAPGAGVTIVNFTCVSSVFPLVDSCGNEREECGFMGGTSENNTLGIRCTVPNSLDSGPQ